MRPTGGQRRFRPSPHHRLPSRWRTCALERQKEHLALIRRALGEALSDLRYDALRQAKMSDASDPLDAMAGWDADLVATIMQMRSAERVGHALARATFILALATAALVATTIALVAVTVAR